MQVTNTEQMVLVMGEPTLRRRLADGDCKTTASCDAGKAGVVGVADKADSQLVRFGLTSHL